MSRKIKPLHEKNPTIPCSKFSKKVFFEYAPGETSFQLGYLGANKSTVEGTLRLRYTDDKPIFAKKIVLHLVGKEYVFFAGTLKEGQDDTIKEDDDSELCDNDDEVSAATISTYAAKRQIFLNKITIWRSQSKGHYESVKFLDLPFKLNLPDNLPPSVLMDKGCGRIYYMLKAVISRQPIVPNYSKKKKIIKYEIPIVRHTIIPQPKLIRWFRKEEGPAKPHVFDYDVSMERSAFSPGESVIVPVKLFFHEPQVYLKKIFVGVKEYHELRTDKYSTSIKRYIVEETIQADSIPISSGPDNECFVEVKLNLPTAKQLIYNVNSTYITVSHKLKVKINFGRAPNLHLSNFINIENLVNEDEILPPPSPAIDIPQKVIAAHEPVITKPKHESYRRLTPFFPLFNKIQSINDNSTKKNSIQQSKNRIIYNSRSFLIQLDDFKKINNINNIKDIKNIKNIKNNNNVKNIESNTPTRIVIFD